MIILNITTQLVWDIHEDWKLWVVQKHVPDMLATGLISGYQIVRLLNINDEDGPTYALQLHLQDYDMYCVFNSNHENQFDRNERELWGDRLCSFKTLMEVIN